MAAASVITDACTIALKTVQTAPCHDRDSQSNRRRAKTPKEDRVKMDAPAEAIHTTRGLHLKGKSATLC